MKAYSNDLRLKVVGAVDRGKACQGIAYNHEALEEAIPIPYALSHQSGWRT
jgi:hypothetical protein